MPWIANNNRDSADYTTSMRTDRWYLCIFFWLLNRVVHQLYVTMIYCGKYEIGPEWWQEMYLNKNGRKRFQIDLARELMNYAIRESWTDMDSAKPDWMRRALVIPCNCNKCFFCIQNLTTGIDHKQKRKTVTTFIQHDCTHTRPWTAPISELICKLEVTIANNVTGRELVPGMRRWMGSETLEWAVHHAMNICKSSVLDGAVMHWILIGQT